MISNNLVYYLRVLVDGNHFVAATKLSVAISGNKVNRQGGSHMLCNDMTTVLFRKKNRKNLKNFFDDYAWPDNNNIMVKIRMSLTSVKRLIVDLQ